LAPDFEPFIHPYDIYCNGMNNRLLIGVGDMNKKFPFIWIILICIFLSMASGVKASPIHVDRIGQIAELNGRDTSQAFGGSVAISGDTVAVGDPFDNQLGTDVGAVTIYQSDAEGDWVEITRIFPSVVMEGMWFGRNIALSGDRLVVGAPANIESETKAGSAYIYERNQGGPNAWGEVARLTASDSQPNDNYGWAVTTSGDTVIVGAYTRPIGGRVYIYERDEGGPGLWGESGQLSPDAPGYAAGFGESLDLDGDLLAVGAYAGGDYAGYVYVFQRAPATNQWQRLTRFRAADTYAYHFFGYAVALDNWTILAGAPGVDGMKGAAYIFTADPAQPDTWTEQARLSASDGVAGDFFALELDLSGKQAWIGASDHAGGTGAGYLYTSNTPGSWEEVVAITGDDTVEGDEFAYWVSIDGSLAVAGAPGHLPHGAAYIFDLNQPWRSHLPLIYR
jgi:hypothetical protein